MGKKPNVFEAFCEVPPEKRQLPLQALYDYQKFYMELVKKYRQEIEFINGLHTAHTSEVTKFYYEDLPAIEQKLKGLSITEEVREEWVRSLHSHVSASFEMSQKFIDTLTTKKIEEFDADIKAKIDEITKAQNGGAVTW